MATWQVQDAKTRISELIERARTEGPQTITRHGAERAVVLSIEDYRQGAADRANGAARARPRRTRITPGRRYPHCLEFRSLDDPDVLAPRRLRSKC
jgi:prevent-host-death family protein